MNKVTVNFSSLAGNIRRHFKRISFFSYNKLKRGKKEKEDSVRSEGNHICYGGSSVAEILDVTMTNCSLILL